MKVYYFSIQLPYSRCRMLYDSGPPTVLLTADSGERVQLPTRNLRPFIDSMGLKGRFKLVVDDNNKVKSFNKISPVTGQQ
ncbi:DUF2835 domain-containing protein [Aestuariibacter halophilus]|uniref:DUF2835 domain-containing protein n=1 Tax=Fluctibacter halophilus TaxID=226011 RepID=A0ABS8G564_9ALTE|nr:DUF2835 family protein [Aestuariibacter halophilus]MCC2615670.1 DUF2835 domain-containing protein [Aestuariibacter halophilus]